MKTRYNNGVDGDVTIGQTIAGRFRVSRMLGEDALGKRFLCRDRQTRKPAQLLLFRPAIVASHAAEIARSGELAAALDHPHVAQTLHQSIDGERALRVVRWEAARPLGQHLEPVPLLASSVRWALEIARALSAAHAVGLVHRGIAPFTVHISERAERAVVHDWGLWGMVMEGRDPLSATGLSFIGGARWLAPEYIQGGDFDARSDLYALGALLFHLLTGNPPYTGPELKVLAAHVHDPIPAPSERIAGIPHWLDELVLELLAKNPAHRPGDAAEVAARLEEGYALVRDGAAHPDRVTASVAPRRLPHPGLTGAAAHALPKRAPSSLPNAPSEASIHPPERSYRYVGLAVLLLAGLALLSLSLF